MSDYIHIIYRLYNVHRYRLVVHLKKNHIIYEETKKEILILTPSAPLIVISVVKFWGQLKVAFFSESSIRFSNLQNKYSKSLSWTWNLNIIVYCYGRKIQISSSGFWFGISLMEVWQTHHTFWKKATFRSWFLLKNWF